MAIIIEGERDPKQVLHEQMEAEKTALKERLKGKKLTQTDINDLVIWMAKLSGLLE